MAREIETQLMADLKDYVEDVRDVVLACQKKAGNYTARHLRNSSPRKTGEYASGWGAKTEADGLAAVTTVYNRKQAWKTQLLENGHVIRNKKGDYGRTPARPHIKPAEEDGANYFEQLLRKELER